MATMPPRQFEEAPRRGRRRRGPWAFTLVELLVVIAVIALLVSIVAPTLRRATDVTRAAICMSNLHQQAVSVRSYQAEHRGVFPDHRTDAYTGSETDRYWATTLLEYGTTKEVYRCPGIGESRARAVLVLRKQNGGFKSVDELAQVKGIGATALDRMRPYVRTQGKTTAQKQ